METHLKLQCWLLHSSASWISHSLLSSQMSGKPWWISKSRNRSCPVKHTAAAFGRLPNTSSLEPGKTIPNRSLGALPWDFPLSWCYRGAWSWAVPAPTGIMHTAGRWPMGWRLPLAVISSEVRTKRGGGWGPANPVIKWPLTSSPGVHNAGRRIMWLLWKVIREICFSAGILGIILMFSFNCRQEVSVFL